MATIYWNFDTSAWQTSATAFEDSTKLAYWSSGTSDTNNQALLSYRVYCNNTNGKLYLQFKIRSKNKSFDTARNGYLCSSSYYTGSYYLTIEQGSTQVFKYTPLECNSQSTSTDTLEKMPKLSQSTSWAYNTASEDGSTVTVPWTVEVTSYAGKALTVSMRLSWARIYTISGVKYIERDNMTTLGEKTLCTLPAVKYTVAYNQNGHGTAPTSQTKYPNASVSIKAYIADQTTGGVDTTVTITGNAAANGGTWSGSNGNAHYNTLKHVYEQTSWNTNSGGTGTKYTESQSYSTNANLTLYAIWKDTTTAATGTSYTLPTGTPTKASSTTNALTVTFNPNNGSTTKSSETSTKPVTYSFKGWFTTATGNVQRTTASRVIAAETVYAQFNETIGAQASVTLPTAAQCTRNGYTLLGFSTSDTATTATYLPGSTYTPTASIVLFAVWESLSSVTPKVYVGGVWKDASVFVYVNGVWKPAEPNLRVGTEWKK